MTRRREPAWTSLSLVLLAVVALTQCRSALCADGIDWEAIYGAARGADPCAGDDQPMECSIRHNQLFTLTKDGELQPAGDGQSENGQPDAPIGGRRFPQKPRALQLAAVDACRKRRCCCLCLVVSCLFGVGYLNCASAPPFNLVRLLAD